MVYSEREARLLKLLDILQANKNVGISKRWLYQLMNVRPCTLNRDINLLKAHHPIYDINSWVMYK